ncbi:MAG: tetratricopeptide repeat protein [Xanthomonadales bacterium]|jgi:adenylate cyclase|nr:tetratricopeptide repeat protein [Xanthomonadales bacterium]
MERRLAAVLSADAVGYTALMARDEQAALTTLDGHRAIMGGLVRQHGGRVVDMVGDNLLAEFPSAVDAVQCAVEIQRHLAEANDALPEDQRMRFRIGVNVGDLVVIGDRIAGDGVNVAARLEAGAEPGSIAVSRAVVEQVEGKVPLTFRDRGEQAFKNVPRPVRVYQVLDQPPGDTPGTGIGAAGGTKRGVPEHIPGFGGRSAIAVLPFRNLSNDPEQDYFADGLAEDLIASLAALRIYPIISRNSSFAFKGREQDSAQAGRELGAHYVVTGSVRRSGQRVRVSAELEDAYDGHQVWSARYDRELDDLIAVQDEITAAIAGAVGPALIQSEMLHAIRRSPENPDAWDCVHRGFWHLYRHTPEDIMQAKVWAERALELQADLPMAHSIIAFSDMYGIIYGWSENREAQIRDARRSAEAAVALERDNPTALTALGFALSLQGDRERALAVLERAVEVNPSSALALWSLGATLNVAGRPDEGIPMVEKAIRLSPRDPLMHEFLFTIAAAHLQAGRIEEAVDYAEQSLALNGDQPAAWRVLAVGQVRLGHEAEAQRAVRQLRRLAPDLQPEELIRMLGEDHGNQTIEDLRAAGWSQ